MRREVVLREAGGAAEPRRLRWLACAALAVLCPCACGAEVPATARFRKDVQPILKEYCYDCHGDGAKKGNVAFDKLTSDAALLNHDLWFRVLKNKRKVVSVHACSAQFLRDLLCQAK